MKHSRPVLRKWAYRVGRALVVVLSLAHGSACLLPDGTLKEHSFEPSTRRPDAGTKPTVPTVDHDTVKDSGRPAASMETMEVTPASSSRADAGASRLPTIRCPSNLVCTTAISVVLSALDPNVKADTAVCAQSSVLPMPVSCKSDDDCKSARLTSAECVQSYCIQACIK